MSPKPKGIQTQFYFIRKSFDYLEDNKAKKKLVDQLTADYTELESSSWQEFWSIYGYEIYQNTWEQKYPHYTIEEQTSEETKEWTELWTAHVLEVNAKQWNYFQELFYMYYCEVKISLELENNHSAVVTSENEIEKESCAIIADFEQLKLLGLPTSFGTQNTRKSFKKKSNNSRQSEEHLNYFLEETTSDSGDTETECDTNMEKKSKIISKRKAKKLNTKIPAIIREDPSLMKYWTKRFSLFSRFDEGIKLDRESWFSVTPEKVANHLATRLACDIIVDGFCGCGGNTIQFAKTCSKVIAIDIDPNKLAMAKHNARVYGVDHKIEFILGDFLKICETLRLRADRIFLSPPWGGPNYKRKKSFDIEKFLLPVGASKLKQYAEKISDNVVLFLPRNSEISKIIKLSGPGNQCEVENHYLDTRLVAISAFYGEGIVGKRVSK